jgi:8-oxo-dGTP pyrophosphatase MutT (NUDIX family)
MTDPNNTSTLENPVGRFMVAVGAIIQHEETGKILLAQRSHDLDWHPGEWEIGYGRVAQFESAEEGLRREVKEELGIEDLEIVRVQRVWHIYRGSKKAENDLIGITFHCMTGQENVQISAEHQGYQWVNPNVALEMVRIPGIREDIEEFIRGR